MAGVAAIRRAVLSDAAPARLGLGWWIAALAVTIGTNILDFLTAPRPGEELTAAFIPAALVRVVLVFWIGYLLVRRMMRATPAQGDRWTLPRYVALTLVLAIGYGMTQKIADLSLGQENLANRWLLMLAVSAAWTIILIRTTAWSAALAAGRRFRVLPSLWRSLSGRHFALSVVFAQLILPLIAIHLALALLSVTLILPPRALIGMAVVDGVVSAGQMVLTAALQQTALILADRP
ncbi:hypothetical protein [Sphingomonas sp. ID0503]|uniref:hypothetical protein n=1 Tax=Sphingomonas sp. ID0503 TaxID=3399691 RepID=UPI003AFA12E4